MYNISQRESSSWYLLFFILARRMCLQCGIPKTYSSARGMVCPVCGDRPQSDTSQEPKKKGSTIKDKEKSKRMKGQSSHATWKSETEMQLRQQFDQDKLRHHSLLETLMFYGNICDATAYQCIALRTKYVCSKCLRYLFFFFSPPPWPNYFFSSFLPHLSLTTKVKV